MAQSDTPAEVGSSVGLGAWRYTNGPAPGEDVRCLVTLRQQGEWYWVGIRAYSHKHNRWFNGGEPERDDVIAWQPLPLPATGRWIRGVLQGA
jgi:hypothetical protein